MTTTQENNAGRGPALVCRAWLGRYRRALAELEKCKADRFYHGTPVTVDCPRYKGPGTAVTDNQCPPDQVAVLLENGNVWWYPMEACRPDDQAHRPGGETEIDFMTAQNANEENGVRTAEAKPGSGAASGSGARPDICPKCRKRGKPRSGADFAGEMICYKCWHVWPWVAANGYGHLP